MICKVPPNRRRYMVITDPLLTRTGVLVLLPVRQVEFEKILCKIGAEHECAVAVFVSETAHLGH